VFVQAGVGGLASAVAGYLSDTLGDARPCIVIVEPERSACLLASHDAGKPVAVAQDEATIMAMLECQEPSLTAWRVLARLADAFMTVSEEDAVSAVRALAKPRGADPAITAGESGAAGLAGLLAASASEEARRALELGDDSVVLLFNTEGATPGKPALQEARCALRDQNSTLSTAPIVRGRSTVAVPNSGLSVLAFWKPYSSNRLVAYTDTEYRSNATPARTSTSV